MKIKMQAGKYYIGDPCYVMSDEDWQLLLNQTKYLNCEGSGVWAGDFNGHRIVAGSTACGDGGYQGSDNVEYCVDSGTLAIVSIGLVSKPVEDHDLGSIVEFDSEFYVEVSEYKTENQGLFRFGNINIDTRGYDD